MHGITVTYTCTLELCVHVRTCTLASVYGTVCEYACCAQCMYAFMYQRTYVHSIIMSHLCTCVLHVRVHCMFVCMCPLCYFCIGHVYVFYVSCVFPRCTLFAGMGTLVQILRRMVASLLTQLFAVANSINSFAEARRSVFGPHSLCMYHSFGHHELACA